jgi:HAE1 family hydrophobic/amphiphilic exporter-1
MNISELCIRRPVFAAMLVLALVVVGAAGYFRLGVDRFPSVDLPTVSVRTSLPGASAEESETLVSDKIEQAINTVDGISELRSISGQGTSVVMVTFDLNRNLESAAQDVRDKVATVVSQLPEDAQPPVVQKFDNDSQPVMTLALSSDRSIRELTELADKTIRPQIERAGGVGEVRIVGGLDRGINVWIDAERLAAYQIPVTDVRNALIAQNADVPGGNMETGRRELTVRTMGRVTEPRDFNDLVIKQIGGSPIRIRDIGHVEDGTKEQRSLARLDGVPTVTLEIRRQSGSNTVEVIQNVKRELVKANAQLPTDVKLEVIRDQSRYIDAALHEINTHLILGSLLACLVVLAFMRNLRATIIAGVAIPASVISAFGMMWALHFTLNSVTMLALVLMVGIVIDDAIVVLENIFRFIEEKRLTPREAAKAATKDIGLAVLATTLSLVVIFLPVSFMSSISGRFLYQFGITAAVAILVSLLVSFSLTPMMSARLLKVPEEEKQDEGEHGVGCVSDQPAHLGHRAASRAGFYSYIDRAYTALLGLALRHRVIVIGIAIAVILSSIPLYRSVKQEFIPSNVDEAEFELSVNGPEGTNLDSMNEAMKAIEGELKQVRGVRLVLSSAGGSFLGGVNQGGAYIRIAPHEERTFSLTRLFWETVHLHPWKAWQGNYSQSDVMQEVRRRLRKFAPMRISVRNSQSFNFGVGGNSDIDFALRGPDLVQLSKYADQLKAKSDQVGGIVDADTTLKLDKPEQRIRIDRSRAGDLGVSTNDIATSVRLLVGGDDEVTRFRDNSTGEDYDVALRLTEKDRGDQATISRLLVPAAGAGRPGDDKSTDVKAGLVRLDNLVKITEETGPSRIDRLNRERQVSLRASVAPGYALADRIEALRVAAAQLNMPPAYSYTVSGKGRELERTFVEFIFAFMLSVIFMYMILASQFESVIHPVTILLSLPLAVPFALLSQWMTGNTLNLYSALGILVLFGVVKKNAILQIDHMNSLRQHGLERSEAIMLGCRDRLRPILMTTMALVAGMLPLAVGTGPGSEERRSIAVVVIGGQTLSLLLTLVVTPVAYSVFDDVGASANWREAALGLLHAPANLAGRLRTVFARKRPSDDEENPPTDEGRDGGNVPLPPSTAESGD